MSKSWCRLQGAALDRHSTCCASGKLDACGACDGPAKAVDVQNVCCASGVLDGNGYCCQSGLLDECGVCDGQSTACALRAVVDVQVSASMVMRFSMTLYLRFNCPRTAIGSTRQVDIAASEMSHTTKEATEVLYCLLSDQSHSWGHRHLHICSR